MQPFYLLPPLSQDSDVSNILEDFWDFLDVDLVYNSARLREPHVFNFRYSALSSELSNEIWYNDVSMGKKKRSIKKDILAKILCSTGLRYTDARPRNIDNDLYNYHLQHLVKKGLVKKDGSRYSLTLAGKKYVEVVEPVDPKGQTADLFRLNVLAILLDRRKDRIKILSQIKKTSPYFGDKGVIGGAVKLGEFSTKAAARRFKEETGLNAKFNLIGVIRLVRMYPHNELFSDIIFNVCVATSHGGKLIQKSRFGTNQWIDIKTAIRNESESVQSSKELVKVLKLLRDKKPSDISFFYKEEVSKLKSI